MKSIFKFTFNIIIIGKKKNLPIFLTTTQQAGTDSLILKNKNLIAQQC